MINPLTEGGIYLTGGLIPNAKIKINIDSENRKIEMEEAGHTQQLKDVENGRSEVLL